MSKRENFLFIVVVVMFAVVAVAAGPRASIPKARNKPALREADVKQLLLLMDTNRNGKISKQEYMIFMEKELEKLDNDKNGELDPKELAHSELRASHPFTSGEGLVNDTTAGGRQLNFIRFAPIGPEDGR